MKKTLLLLASTVLTTPAMSADIIVPPPPPPAPLAIVAPPTWSGLYVGGQLGAAFGSDFNGLDTNFDRFDPDDDDNDSDDSNPGDPGNPGNPDDPGNPDNPGGPNGDGGFAGACAETTDVAACAAVGDLFDYFDEAALAGARTEDTGAGAVVLDDGEGGDGAGGSGGSGGSNSGGSGSGGGSGASGGAGSGGSGGGDGPTVGEFIDEDDTSFIGGAHIGYNYQFGNFVVGAVTDLSYVDSERVAGFSNGIDTIRVTQELDYLGTARLKAGFAAERFMIYGTGGLGYGNVETRFVNTVADDDEAEDDFRIGYSLGAGADFLATPNLIFGVEYLYTNLGDDDFEASYPVGGGDTFDVSVDDDYDLHTVWAKASYRFN